MKGVVNMRAIDKDEIWSTGCECCVHEHCKRLMHPRLSFARPWFADINSAAKIGRALCSDFKCSKAFPYKYKVWQNYSIAEWYKTFGRKFKEVEFVLDNDQSVRYSVDYADFFYGNLIVDGKFNAVEKIYYKQIRKGFGYKLVIEKLENGIDI